MRPQLNFRALSPILGIKKVNFGPLKPNILYLIENNATLYLLMQDPYLQVGAAGSQSESDVQSTIQ